MIPHVSRGGSATGLVAYLVGEGRANEHAEPHLVAGSGDLMAWFGTDVLDRVAAGELGRALDRHRLEFGTEVLRAKTIVDPESGESTKVPMPAHVWHCSLAVKAGEGELSDEVWGRIAEDFVTGMGFAPTAERPDGCTWIAVRHGLSANGNDHVHLALNLVRSDGTVADTWRDFARAQALAGQLEQRYGLTVLEGRQLELGGRDLTAGESTAPRGRVPRSRSGAGSSGRSVPRLRRRWMRGSSSAGSSRPECSLGRGLRPAATMSWLATRLPSGR